MDEEIQAQGLDRLDGHHRLGQARPVAQDPDSLVKIKDGPIIEAINAAWDSRSPGRRRL